MISYVRFDPPRRVEQYLGSTGPHDGLALPPFAYAAIADAKAAGGPSQYVVQGEWRGEKTWLDLAVDPAWLEMYSHYRRDVHGRFRWTCPQCGRAGGHERGCGYER